MATLTFYYNKDLTETTPLKLEYLRAKVNELKGIFQPAQKSKEWYEMRNGMLTASDWGAILGENHYSSPNEVLKKKCNPDAPFFTNAAMAWGNKYEDVAVLVYEYRNQTKVYEFGCLQHPRHSFLGASPDGITADGIMLEIKCPTSRKITGIPPSYYWCQVQGQLEVCELDRCDFLECSFKEFGEDEYCEDFLPERESEKGVIAEFYHRVEKKNVYEYSPIGIQGAELEKWKRGILVKNEFESSLIFQCFSYWYLKEVSCVPIYRNQEWFHEKLPVLADFWGKVVKYRKAGMSVLLQDLQMAKSSAKGETSPSEKNSFRFPSGKDTGHSFSSGKDAKTSFSSGKDTGHSFSSGKDTAHSFPSGKDASISGKDANKKQKKIREYIIFDTIENPPNEIEPKNTNIKTDIKTDINENESSEEEDDTTFYKF